MAKPETLSFVEKLNEAITTHNSLLCLGLDPNPAQFPAHFPAIIDTQALIEWGRALIDQTHDLVCCYKPNFAFYEQFGSAGLEALRQTIAAAPADIPVLLDAKRGDIGSTAAAYAQAAFEVWGADAVTVNPYLGRDSIEPFLAYPGKMVFVLCFTSNPSAAAIQEFGPAGEPLFAHVARQGQGWGDEEQVGFVVGATQPQALARFRRLSPERWVLAPGVGAQGGDVTAAVNAGLNSRGSGLIVPVSRAILYADSPREAALSLRQEINQARQAAQPQIAPDSLTELTLALHQAGCVQFGEFTLASGQQSPIYLDLRWMSSQPALLRQAAQAYAELLRPLSFDHLAAVPYAALTIGTAVALATGHSLIYPRKEVKEYGTGRAVEGVFSAGQQAVIVEDLVTSGGSVLNAIQPLEAAGLTVKEVVVLIDREQGGREHLAQAGYRLHAALTLSGILETLEQAGHISAEQAETVKNY